MSDVFQARGASIVQCFWYGTVNVDLYSAIITKVSNALNTLVSGEKPGFQALSKGLVVLLCSEVVRQGVPDHGAVHSECSASETLPADNISAFVHVQVVSLNAAVQMVDQLCLQCFDAVGWAAGRASGL